MRRNNGLPYIDTANPGLYIGFHAAMQHSGAVKNMVDEDGKATCGAWFCEESTQAELPLWKEALCGGEIVALHLSPVFYGRGVPRGDGSAVILIPGFLLPDAYLAVMRSWLRRMGYKAYASGVGVTSNCPNLMIERCLRPTLEQALEAGGHRKAHLIGHSLGGVMARSLAAQRPKDVASVITLASPFRGTAAHRVVLRAADGIRRKVLGKNDPEVLPECYTGHCGCAFLQAVRGGLPAGVRQTAIYTRQDGVVDWRYCVTGDAKADFEVRGTHMGLAFNPGVYALVARRLAQESGAEAAV